MTQYRTYIDSDITTGLETIQSIQTNGTEYGIGISSDVVCNNISAGIITASQVNASIVGVSTLSVGYASTAGISTYADTAGISTVSQGLTGTPNITVGIVTASAYVATGTTAVYAGINTSTIDSNTTAFHYISYDTNNSAVNISNFGSGKKFEILARNTSGGNRTIIIRTSTTTSGHVAVPTLLSNGVAPVTNGTFTLAAGNGIYISVFNMNGTVAGYYA